MPHCRLEQSNLARVAGKSVAMARQATRPSKRRSSSRRSSFVCCAKPLLLAGAAATHRGAALQKMDLAKTFSVKSARKQEREMTPSSLTHHHESPPDSSSLTHDPTQKTILFYPLITLTLFNLRQKKV